MTLRPLSGIKVFEEIRVSPGMLPTKVTKTVTSILWDISWIVGIFHCGKPTPQVSWAPEDNFSHWNSKSSNDKNSPPAWACTRALPSCLFLIEAGVSRLCFQYRNLLFWYLQAFYVYHVCVAKEWAYILILK